MKDSFDVNESTKIQTKDCSMISEHSDNHCSVSDNCDDVSKYLNDQSNNSDTPLDLSYKKTQDKDIEQTDIVDIPQVQDCDLSNQSSSESDCDLVVVDNVPSTSKDALISTLPIFVDEDILTTESEFSNSKVTVGVVNRKRHILNKSEHEPKKKKTSHAQRSKYQTNLLELPLRSKLYKALYPSYTKLDLDISDTQRDFIYQNWDKVLEGIETQICYQKNQCQNIYKINSDDKKHFYKLSILRCFKHLEGFYFFVLTNMSDVQDIAHLTYVTNSGRLYLANYHEISLVKSSEALLSTNSYNARHLFNLPPMRKTNLNYCIIPYVFYHSRLLDMQQKKCAILDVIHSNSREGSYDVSCYSPEILKLVLDNPFIFFYKYDVVSLYYENQIHLILSSDLILNHCIFLDININTHVSQTLLKLSDSKNGIHESFNYNKLSSLKYRLYNLNSNKTLSYTENMSEYLTYYNCKNQLWPQVQFVNIQSHEEIYNKIIFNVTSKNSINSSQSENTLITFYHNPSVSAVKAISAIGELEKSLYLSENDVMNFLYSQGLKKSFDLALPCVYYDNQTGELFSIENTFVLYMPLIVNMLLLLSSTLDNGDILEFNWNGEIRSQFSQAFIFHLLLEIIFYKKSLNLLSSEKILEFSNNCKAVFVSYNVPYEETEFIPKVLKDLCSPNCHLSLVVQPEELKEYKKEWLGLI
ncbi:hypothetical protein AB837_00264 [bacterium AB1]|nr:hypothetical protein AB837_00264 [bacterium AB1]